MGRGPLVEVGVVTELFSMLEICRVITLVAVVFQMKSIGYNSSDSSLFLQTDRQKPSLREGDVLIKVGIISPLL